MYSTDAILQELEDILAKTEGLFVILCNVLNSAVIIDKNSCNIYNWRSVFITKETMIWGSL